jgi:hypothetical protein
MAQRSHLSYSSEEADTMKTSTVASVGGSDPRPEAVGLPDGSKQLFGKQA